MQLRSAHCLLNLSQLQLPVQGIVRKGEMRVHQLDRIGQSLSPDCQQLRNPVAGEGDAPMLDHVQTHGGRHQRRHAVRLCPRVSGQEEFKAILKAVAKSVYELRVEPELLQTDDVRVGDGRLYAFKQGLRTPRHVMWKQAEPRFRHAPLFSPATASGRWTLEAVASSAAKMIRSLSFARPPPASCSMERGG